MASLFLSIPSRDRPNELAYTLSLIQDRLATKSVVIQVVLDQDNKDLYADLQNQRTDIQWRFLPPVNHIMRTIYLFQFESFLCSQHDLYCMLPDDMTDIPYGWDAAVLKCANRYEDDLFCIYSGSTGRGRHPDVCASCYTKVIGNPLWAQNPYLTGFHVGEMYPAYSRRWVYFLCEVFRNGKNVVGHDIASAILVRLLFERYRENRHVLGTEGNLNCIDQAVTYQVLLNNPLDNTSLDKVVGKMYNYIIENKTGLVI